MKLGLRPSAELSERNELELRGDVVLQRVDSEWLAPSRFVLRGRFMTSQLILGSYWVVLGQTGSKQGEGVGR
jgi:hypothetical protein